ncbi:hypothetical protein [Nocardia sp. NPDC059195]|uniref:hypothetical protein n=1 Tax=Nocardia sp. NPDC059195 TaxID=3346765 RepID=UPI003684BF42
MKPGSEHADPQRQFFHLLSNFSYAEVNKHTTKGSFTDALRREAYRINESRGFGRSDYKIITAVDSCSEWTWKNMSGKPAPPTKSNASTTLTLTLPHAADEQLRARADAVGVGTNELATRWVLAGLLTGSVSSSALSTLIDSQPDSLF